ncbi:unnamed protein product [Anisakis simplex]|uniref:Uncharacterized protein n=1 Tax=Anisakis simplex TaxID=6269 RepID=A0A0M3KI58_ANISI|nr:unnamed protein product [Anisakis simplex]
MQRARTSCERVMLSGDLAGERSNACRRRDELARTATFDTDTLVRSGGFSFAQERRKQPLKGEFGKIALGQLNFIVNYFYSLEQFLFVIFMLMCLIAFSFRDEIYCSSYFWYSIVSLKIIENMIISKYISKICRFNSSLKFYFFAQNQS